jgi:hypothetical protein
MPASKRAEKSAIFQPGSRERPAWLKGVKARKITKRHNQK